jgi:hypothetical protein
MKQRQLCYCQMTRQWKMACGKSMGLSRIQRKKICDNRATVSIICNFKFRLKPTAVCFPFAHVFATFLPLIHPFAITFY